MTVHLTSNRWRLKIAHERSDHVEMHDATEVVSWSVRLKCPHCGERGGATLSDSGADLWFRVETIAPGFEVLDRPHRAPDIRCVACNASSLCA